MIYSNVASLLMKLSLNSSLLIILSTIVLSDAISLMKSSSLIILSLSSVSFIKLIFISSLPRRLLTIASFLRIDAMKSSSLRPFSIYSSILPSISSAERKSDILSVISFARIFPFASAKPFELSLSISSAYKSISFSSLSV